MALVRFVLTWLSVSSRTAVPATGRPCTTRPCFARPNSKLASPSWRLNSAFASNSSSDARAKPAARSTKPPRRPGQWSRRQVRVPAGGNFLTLLRSGAAVW